MDDNSPRTIDAVETTFSIVKYLREQGPSRLSDIAEAVDRSVSTTHVHLQTLRKHDYASQSNGRYELGLAFLRDGGQVRQDLNVYRAGKQEVTRLAEETQEASHLAVERRGRRVILYKTEIGEAVYDNTPTGEFTNMHWTSTGKAILAHLPDSRIESIISEHGLPGATDNTITDPETLFDHLETVREEGHAVEREERRAGVVAVAVPIFDTTSEQVIAAISVSGPRQRILTTEGTIDAELIESLRNRANVTELRYNHY